MNEVIIKLTSDRIKIKGGEYVRDYPHGEWIYGIDEETGEEDCYPWTCSVCGEKHPWQPNFCPNCGADMRKGSE